MRSAADQRSRNTAELRPTRGDRGGYQEGYCNSKSTLRKSGGSGRDARGRVGRGGSPRYRSVCRVERGEFRGAVQQTDDGKTLISIISDLQNQAVTVPPRVGFFERRGG
jgi:hypothetical protein